MQTTTALSNHISLSRFDRIVIMTLLLLATGTLLLVWRGDQVGVQLISASPAAGSDDVSARAEIRLTFDQPLAAATTGQPLWLSPAVNGVTQWDGATLSFRPAESLTPGVTYQVHLSEALAGLQGRAVTGETGWQFTVRQPAVLYVGPDEAGVDQLFKVDPAAGRVTKLTAEPVGVFDYALSPDAATVAYAALREDGGSDLWALPGDGGQAYPLLLCPEAVCNGAAWTVDGQQLVYERRVMQVSGAAPGPPRLWWLAVGSGETAPVFDDSQMLGYGAVWSPDGQWLSYVAPSSQGVQLYDVEGGQSLVIPSRMGGLAVWSPDGEAVLVTDIQPQAEGFAVHLLKAAPEGGELIDISGEGAIVEDSSPAWSPDGSWLAFTRKVASASMGKQIWLMRPDGSQARYLTNDTGVHHSLPQWSPDGAMLVYHRFPLKEINAQSSIWLLEVETGQTRQLVEAGNRPTWWP